MQTWRTMNRVKPDKCGDAVLGAVLDAEYGAPGCAGRLALLSSNERRGRAERSTSRNVSSKVIRVSASSKGSTGSVPAMLAAIAFRNRVR
jgi:hypothetical protein